MFLQVTVLMLISTVESAYPFQNTTGGNLGVPILLTSKTNITTSIYTSYDTENCQTLNIQTIITSIPTKPTLIAKCNTSIPSTNNQQQFTGFTELGGSTEQVLFLGEGNGSWGKQNKFMGIYSQNYSQNSTDNKALYKVVDTSDHLPTGERFKVVCCGRTVPNDTGDVVFAGASEYDGEGIEGIYIWKANSNAIVTVIDNSIQVLQHISGPSRVTLSGDIYFYGDNPLLHFVDGIYRINIFTPNATLIPIVTIGDEMPSEGPFAKTFTAFGSPISAYDSSTIVFTASGTFGVLGLYSMNVDVSKEIHLIIDNTISNVCDFPTDPSVNSNGHVIFNALTNEESTSGLYYWNGIVGKSSSIIENLQHGKYLNIDTQYNSMGNNQQIVYYTTTGKCSTNWLLDLKMKTKMKTTVAMNVTVTTEREKFHAWQAQFNKTDMYSKMSIIEIETRFDTWIMNKNRIHQHNINRKKRKKNWKMKMNAMGDLTSTQFQALHRSKTRSSTSVSSTTTWTSTKKPPISWDWRQHHAVSPVKNQFEPHSCGSCWAFSAVSGIESRYAMDGNNIESFSAQNIIDCTLNGKDTCDQGGEMHAGVLQVSIEQNGSINTAETYPYTGYSKGTCHFDATTSIHTNVSGYSNVTVGDEASLLSAVAFGGVVPAGINSDADAFMFYTAGILDIPVSKCASGPNDLDHGVAIVGYGTESGVDYWLVKNSYGLYWGEKGYFRIVRGRNSCGIATDCIVVLGK